MKADDIEAMIEENKSTADELCYYVQVYWQDGADNDGLVSLVQKNWASPSEPCSQERATKAVMGIHEHKSDALMLAAFSQKEAEQLVLQAISLGAVAQLDD